MMQVEGGLSPLQSVDSLRSRTVELDSRATPGGPNTQFSWTFGGATPGWLTVESSTGRERSGKISSKHHH
jgi:hypothetical protein